MDKKSANGFPSKAGEGGVQRKQLPYSVETPYGFHLDLDFLKYVDDIEKGNTIKRVHIQRRARGPKFSTLPRNFSLPGHGARPAPRDGAWSGTSTLGPAPKSRVTEVQQIFDFRPSDGGTTSCQTSRVTASQGSFSLAKPREEAGAGARTLEEKAFGLQGRPNLLRASSMPVTVQHRKASDSSSPDRVVGTPENGSSENVFRASVDVTERRCVPQDRGGLHQQITVALKRVRELEEQVRTIPELKAQICSLREEREKLILELQAQAKLQAQASVSSASSSSSRTAPSPGPGAHTQPQRPRAPGEAGPPSAQKPTGPEASQRALGHLSEEQATGKAKEGGVEVSRVTERETRRESVKSSVPGGGAGGVTVQEPERRAQPSERPDRQRETLVSQVEHGAEQLSEDITAQKSTPQPAVTAIGTAVSCVQEGILWPYVASDEDLASVHQLQAKLTALETKLTEASHELETTNARLREQVEENKVKEERILQLSEGVTVEVCTLERRVSVDRGTETEKVVISNQETETEAADTVDQGTDTERICIEIQAPRERAGSIERGTATERVDTQDQVTETGAEATFEVHPARRRANSMDRGTETDRVDTQDQVTETPAADKVDQVTETAEAEADHPMRPRASSVDQGTETERVGTVDRVTETEAAQSAEQQTETEKERRRDDNPAGCAAEAESRVTGSAIGERVVEIDIMATEGTDRESVAGENVARESVITEIFLTESVVAEVALSGAVTESVAKESVVKSESETCEDAAVVASVETEAECKMDDWVVVVADVENEIEAGESTFAESAVVESVEAEKVVSEPVVVKPDSEVVSITTKETVTESVIESVVIVVSESSAMKAVVPVRPQRGRRASTEQSQPQAQCEQQAQPKPQPEQQAQPKPQPEHQAQPKPQPEQQVQPKPQLQAPPQRPRRGSSEAQKQPSEPQTPPQPEAQAQAPPQRPRRGSSETPEQPHEPQALSEVQSPPLAETQAPSEAQSPPLAETQAPSEAQSAPPAEVQAPSEAQSLPPAEVQAPSEAQSAPPAEVQAPSEAQSAPPAEVQAPSEDQSAPPAEAQAPSAEAQAQTQVLSKASPEGCREVCTQPQPPQASQTQSQPKPQASGSRRESKELQSKRRVSGDTKQPPRRGSSEVHAQPPRRGSSEVHAQPPRRGSETQAQAKGSRKGSGESQTIRRGPGEAQARGGAGEGQAQGRRSSSEAQAARRDSSAEAQQLSRKGSSSESPTSPAALGQVVTRLTGLLGEQWAQLGSGSGAQQGVVQQESPVTQKQTAKPTTGKAAAAAAAGGGGGGAGKGASAKPAGKAAAAATGKPAGKPAGKPGPSKMSSIQSQLVSSLSVLSAFYSPAQKAAAASKQEQGLKSIMKKDGVADKHGNRGGAKKNLKFVGVNGGYETTSSEESSGDEKTREKEEEEEEDSSGPEVEQPKEEEVLSEEPQEQAGGQGEAAETSAQGGGAVAGEEEAEGAPQDPETSEELQASGDRVDQGFLDACLYVKDRMGEVSSPDKEMRQILLVLYQEWFRVSSQKESQVDTVTVYLRQVSQVTPTLLGYVINLTDGNGNTALHYSVSHSNFPVVKLLLDTGLCETDNVNKAGYTPVMLAALTAADSPDDLEVALQLLRQGGVDIRSSQAGQTALMLAVSHGRVAMVRLLLGCEADVNAQDRDGSTALMCACEHGHLHITRLLLGTGRCDTGLADKDGQTALSVARGASHPDIVDLLRAHAEGRTTSEPPSGATSDPASSTTPH